MQPERTSDTAFGILEGAFISSHRTDGMESALIRLKKKPLHFLEMCDKRTKRLCLSKSLGQKHQTQNLTW